MQLVKYIPDYVVFDLETTGTSFNYDEIIEISAIKVHNHEIVAEFTSFVNPERAIPYSASQVNGITDDMVKDAPVLEEILGDFLKFIDDHVLVGHNIHAFDMKFIYRDCKRYLKTETMQRPICSFRSISQAFRSQHPKITSNLPIN